MHKPTLPAFAVLLSLLVIGCEQVNSKPTAAATTTAPSAAPSAIRDFDIQAFVDQHLQAGEKRIVIPPGRYRVTPKDKVHLVLKDLSDIQILADGVEMICTQTTRALTLAHCRNVTVKGMTIDYDPLPFTQGRITAISDDRQVHEVELFAGYPTADRVQGRYEIFRPDTRALRGPEYSTKIDVVDQTHVRVNKVRPAKPTDPEQVGDLVVMNSPYAPDGMQPHAIVLEGCSGVRLVEVTLYASNCFGFFETNCDGTTYYRCKLDRCPAQEDVVTRADPRLRSTDADAFHSKFAVRGPQLIECTARFQGDDCLNICGDYEMVTHVNGNELRVLGKSQMNIAPGDPVEICTYDGARLPDAVATAIASDGEITADERQFLLRQQMDVGTKTKGMATAYRITLDRHVELPMGSVICSLRHTGRGFLVKGCNFGFNRSRGILIKASDGQVIDNTITASQMSAILVTPEYWWMEAGSSNNVRIANNTIRDCGSADPAICVTAHGGSTAIAPAGAHSNIQISHNTINECGSPAIVVTSTNGLKIENNTGTLIPNRPTVGWLTKAATRPSTGEYPPVMALNCTDETARQNALQLP